jgi:hypothetical protein
VSADLLRRAAATLRERAGKATPGPWSGDPTGTVCADDDLRPDPNGGEILPPEGPQEVAECYRNERSGERGDNAAYIAMLHPPVALALADWLKTVAGIWVDDRAVQHYSARRAVQDSAVKLARAVLREDEEGTR